MLEYTGSAISALSMEERMTVCNMSIEAGARAGMIAPDSTTYDYLRSREFAPADFEAAVRRWQQLPSDPGATYDVVKVFQAAAVAPQLTWGTNPGQVVAVTDVVPDPAQYADETECKSAAQALEYMGLRPGMSPAEIAIDRVFIGSCTNGRIEDLRIAAAVVRGHQVSPRVAGHGRARQCPREIAGRAGRAGPCVSQRGLRMAGRRMQHVPGDEPGQISTRRTLCASTSNRNFEGRQGKGGRTHLVSPAMAAAAAVTGTFRRHPRLGLSVGTGSRQSTNTGV